MRRRRKMDDGRLSKDKGNATTILYHHCYYEGDCRSRAGCECVYMCVCVAYIQPRADGALRILRLMRTMARGVGVKGWERQQQQQKHRDALVCRWLRW